LTDCLLSKECFINGHLIIHQGQLIGFYPIGEIKTQTILFAQNPCFRQSSASVNPIFSL